MERIKIITSSKSHHKPCQTKLTFRRKLRKPLCIGCVAWALSVLVDHPGPAKLMVSEKGKRKIIKNTSALINPICTCQWSNIDQKIEEILEFSKTLLFNFGWQLHWKTSLPKISLQSAGESAVLPVLNVKLSAARGPELDRKTTWPVIFSGPRGQPSLKPLIGTSVRD